MCESEKKKLNMIEIRVNTANLQESSFPYENVDFTGLSAFDGGEYRYLRDLLKSILRVGFDFCLKDNEHGANEEQYERVFAYELYHQWSKYLENEYWNEDRDMRINGEIKKFFHSERKIPDLVLHKQNSDCQKIMVEIKTHHGIRQDNDGMLSDLKKLIKFTCGKVENNALGRPTIFGEYQPYEMGVFILTLENTEVLQFFIENKKEEIQKYMRKFGVRPRSIFCICLPWDEENQVKILEVSPLEELMDYHFD